MFLISAGRTGWQKMMTDPDNPPFKLGFTLIKDGVLKEIPYDTPANLFDAEVDRSTTLQLGKTKNPYQFL